MGEAATSIAPVPQVRHLHTRDIDPHRQLMAAVLQTAVDDCSVSPLPAGYGTLAAQRRLRGAKVYVLSRDRVWPFSFENLCDALDLDARRLRRGILWAPGRASVRLSASKTEQILGWWQGRECRRGTGTD